MALLAENLHFLPSSSWLEQLPPFMSLTLLAGFITDDGALGHFLILLPLPVLFAL